MSARLPGTSSVMRTTDAMAETDEQRFERLYHAHYSRVAAYLVNRAGRELAQDALAQTFEIAWRRFAEIPEQPLPWLLGVARHVLWRLRRAQGRRDALIERVAATVAASVVDHADVLARRELAAAGLAALSERQREAVLLIAWDGLSQREAAAVVGCAPTAFAVRLHRARARLRTTIARLDHQAPSAPGPAGTPRPDTTPSCLPEEA